MIVLAVLEQADLWKAQCFKEVLLGTAGLLDTAGLLGTAGGIHWPPLRVRFMRRNLRAVN